MSYREIINLVLNPRNGNLGNVGVALAAAARGSK